jgi:hypothetical protein
MASPTILRASDPVVGTNAGKSSLITVKFTGNNRGAVESKQEVVSLSAGYRSLMRDDTLAGRSASRSFRNEEREDGCSRMKMVNRLRQKEKWLIWKEFFKDFDHHIGVFFQKCSPDVWKR